MKFLKRTKYDRMQAEADELRNEAELMIIKAAELQGLADDLEYEIENREA